MSEEPSKTEHYNTDLARRFMEIEEAVAGASDPSDFFHILLTEIRHIFKIPYVWLSLADEPDPAQLFGRLYEDPRLRNRLSLVPSQLFQELLISEDLYPVLANSDLKVFFRLMPKRNIYLVRSIAVVPFQVGGRLWGSVNFGDSIVDRYQPGMDTQLLQRFIGRISIQITVHMPDL